MDTLSFSPTSRPDGDSNIDKTGDLVTRLMRAEERLARAEAAQARARQQLRVLSAFGLVACVGAFTIGGPSAAKAQVAITPVIPPLGITAITNAITALQSSVGQLSARLAALEAKTQDISRITDPNTQQPTVRFTGVNVQVVDGLGSTSGDSEDPTGIRFGGGQVNGTGNLIIGYNEAAGNSRDLRTGSHNLIVGGDHSYSSYGGIAVGSASTISAPFAAVSGGVLNTANAYGASVSGGLSNTASKCNTWIGGGFMNSATGQLSSVVGGQGNTASGDWSTEIGGNYSSASSSYATVIGR